MTNNFKIKDGIIVSPDTEKKNRLPPGQSETEKFPVLHYGSVPEININNWRFRIGGLVEKEMVFTWNEFTSLPKIKVLSDIHCVTRWSRLNNLWEGIGTLELKKIIKFKPQAKYVIVTAEQGFTTNLTLNDFFRPDVLFAFKHNGEFLSPEHGFPLRLVVPHLYFWKSAKWVNGVVFTNKNTPGFWESHGYHMRGDPWEEERYSE
jgi:DMSO/TMAO reductase YedYZ molybdopterin-dependent catalytic subunit